MKNFRQFQLEQTSTEELPQELQQDKEVNQDVKKAQDAISSPLYKIREEFVTQLNDFLMKLDQEIQIDQLQNDSKRLLKSINDYIPQIKPFLSTKNRKQFTRKLNQLIKSLSSLSDPELNINEQVQSAKNMLNIVIQYLREGIPLE